MGAGASDIGQSISLFFMGSFNTLIPASLRRRDAFVGPSRIAGVEDAGRHPEKEVDDPAEDEYRHDEPGHGHIDEANEGEDDDRKDPGAPADLPAVGEDCPGVKCLTELPYVGGPHDSKEGMNDTMTQTTPAPRSPTEILLRL